MSEENPDTDISQTDITEADETPSGESGPDLGVRRRQWNRPRLVAFAVLPALALLLGLLAGYLRWEVSSQRDSFAAADESVKAARDATLAMLSYNADSAEKDLLAARDRLTGDFLTSYTDLVKAVVIPGAREKKISSTAQVPAASSVSANAHHAVALLFVDQSTVVGKDKPEATTSSVRVTLDKVDGRWLVSGFEPI